MNVLFITVDSLNRHLLGPFGGAAEFDLRTPGIDRLAARGTIFANHYAGSLPCMPARREFLAGVQEFLWRTWGPLEPFDRPLARVAREGGVITQLVTDHYHYFQHGGHGYIEDFHGWELIRGHEFDAWQTAPAELPPDALARVGIGEREARSTGFLNRAQYLRNVDRFTAEEDFFAPKVFGAARTWLERNGRRREPWFLYVDSFEVHEPLHVPEPYASMYTDEDPADPALSYWPYYGRVDAGESALDARRLAFLRAQYAGKLTMVDRQLERLFDTLDALDLWSDTAVVLTTDHGLYLGEHGWIGKPNCPVYDVLARTPLIVWHPDASAPGGATSALTSAVDLYATMLELLELPAPPGPHSRSLVPLLRGEAAEHRSWALYGYWGRAVNVTDGRMTYLRAPRDPSVEGNAPLYNYSTAMMSTQAPLHPVTPRPDAEAGRFLPYADGPCWRYPLREPRARAELRRAPGVAPFSGDPGQRTSLLFDVLEDPEQRTDLRSARPEAEAQMTALLRRALDEMEAPPEQYLRLGL